MLCLIHTHRIYVNFDTVGFHDELNLDAIWFDTRIDAEYLIDLFFLTLDLLTHNVDHNVDTMCGGSKRSLFGSSLEQFPDQNKFNKISKID